MPLRLSVTRLGLGPMVRSIWVRIKDAESLSRSSSSKKWQKSSTFHSLLRSCSSSKFCIWFNSNFNTFLMLMRWWSIVFQRIYVVYHSIQGSKSSKHPHILWSVHQASKPVSVAGTCRTRKSFWSPQESKRKFRQIYAFSWSYFLIKL